MSSGYDVAQICMNGHVINSRSVEYAYANQKFCDRCGAPTITRCGVCENPIRGPVMDDWLITYHAPKFCLNCGKPFPWTKNVLEATQELALAVDGLSDDDREVLEKSIDEMVRDTPNANIAAVHFKRIMSKVGPQIALTFKDILVNVLSETVKKLIYQ
jgi:hypothetical protein